MADTISGHGQPGPPPSHDIPSQDPGSCCRHPRCRHRVPGRNRRRQEEEATGADSSRSDEGEPAGAASPRGDLQQPRGGVEDASSSKHVPLAQRLRDNRRLTELVGHKVRQEQCLRQRMRLSSQFHLQMGVKFCRRFST